MRINREKMFDNSGYIKLIDYYNDIQDMIKNGPWRLPLRPVDRIQLFLIKLFNNISWFSDNIYIKYPYQFSPAYSIIVSYLKRKNFIDSTFSLNSSISGYKRYFCYKKYDFVSKGYYISGSGVSESKELAFSKSLGELLERNISGIKDTNRRILNLSYDEIRKRSLKCYYPPTNHRFLRIQSEKYKDLNPKSSERIDWVMGENFITGEETHIPKQLTSWVYKRYDIRIKKESRLGDATTSGSGAYFSKLEANNRAILEVIQRDSFFVHYLTKTAPDIIDKLTLPEDIFKKIKHIESFGLIINLLNITTDIKIPSVCILFKTSNTTEQKLGVCASTELTFSEAIESALNELINCLDGINKNFDNEKYDVNASNYIPFINNLDRDGRVAIWQNKEWIEKIDWFISGAKVSYDNLTNLDNPYENSQQKKDVIKKILKDLGEEYYPIIYTPENKAQKDLSFFVSQAFIPICFPMYLLERFGTFDSDRLNKFADFKGVKKWELNSLPHLFP